MTSEKKLKMLAEGLAERFFEDYDQTIEDEELDSQEDCAFVIMNASLDIVVTTIRSVFCEHHWNQSTHEFFELCLKNLDLKSESKNRLN
jgi:hypothetical protein